MLTCAAAHAQTLKVIPIWPEGVPGAKPGGGEERIVDDRVVNVQNPTLTVFPADPAKAVGHGGHHVPRRRLRAPGDHEGRQRVRAGS